MSDDVGVFCNACVQALLAEAVAMPHRRLLENHCVHMSTGADERIMEVEFEDLRLEHNEADENTHYQTIGELGRIDKNRDDYLDDDLEDEDGDEYYSEEDARPTPEDYRQYGMYQSLPIPPGPPDMEAPCDTAEEYLRRVRYTSVILSRYPRAGPDL